MLFRSVVLIETTEAEYDANSASRDNIGNHIGPAELASQATLYGKALVAASAKGMNICLDR